MELPPELNPLQKLDDQAPCWCQSGKAYGSCHKNRAQDRKANTQEALNLLAKQFQKKIGCLHPDAPEGCAGKVVDSHTIQKSGPLKTIAHNGEVYSMRGAINHLVANNGRLLPQRRGISTVSTFPGFCEKHDNSLFEPIENGSFDINSANGFLLHYRNVCAEYHAKISMQFGEPVLRIMDGGRNLFQQFKAQQAAADMNFGASLAEKQLAEERTSLLASWDKQDFDGLKFYYIEYERQLPFVASFSATPKFSPDGKFIQDWSADRLRTLSVSSVNLDGHSGFMMSSTDHDLMAIFASEFEDRQIGTPSNLLRWVVANAENVAFAIDWWDRLSDRRRRHLLDLAMIGVEGDGPDEELAVYLPAIEVLPPSPVVRSISF
jgi:hypothetical protein